LNPKKPEHLIKPTAETTGASTELVQDIVSFYWAEVRKALVDMKGHSVFVESIGTFKVKAWNLELAKDRYQKMINSYKDKQVSNMVTFQRFSIMKDLESRVEKITNVQEMLKKDQDKKQGVKDKRYGNKANLDTPETDI
jgi:nucleoid DNA-binding protein